MQREAKAIAAPGVHVDLILLGSAFSLICLGLGMVFIASNVMALTNYGDPFYFVTPGVLWITGSGGAPLGAEDQISELSALGLPLSGPQPDLPGAGV